MSELAEGGPQQGRGGVEGWELWRSPRVSPCPAPGVPPPPPLRDRGPPASNGQVSWVAPLPGPRGQRRGGRQRGLQAGPECRPEQPCCPSSPSRHPCSSWGEEARERPLPGGLSSAASQSPEREPGAPGRSLPSPFLSRPSYLLRSRPALCPRAAFVSRLAFTEAAGCPL